MGVRETKNGGVGGDRVREEFVLSVYLLAIGTFSIVAVFGQLVRNGR